MNVTVVGQGRVGLTAAVYLAVVEETQRHWQEDERERQAAYVRQRTPAGQALRGQACHQG